MLFTRLARWRDRGFSFIELLAYMAIAALLVLAAIPQFNHYRAKALVANLQNDAHNAGLAAEGALIDAVAARSSGKGAIRLASAIRLTAAATDAQKSAIQNAVASTKTSNGSSLATTFPSDGAFIITASNAATPYKALYASQATRATNGDMLAPGVNLVDDTGAPVGGGDSGTVTPSGPDAKNVKVCKPTAPYVQLAGITPDGATAISMGTDGSVYTAAIDTACSSAWKAAGGTATSTSQSTYIPVANNGTAILVADSGGWGGYYSPDLGKTWTLLPGADTPGGIALMSKDGTRALAASSDDSNSFISYTGLGTASPTATKRTWQCSPQTVRGDSSLTNLFCANNSQKLRESHDGGVTWANSTALSDTVSSLTVSSDGQVVTAVAGRDGTPSGIVQSTDGGKTWDKKPLPVGETIQANNVSASDDGKIIALVTRVSVNEYTYFNDGLISTDSGASWTRMGIKTASDSARYIPILQLAPSGRSFAGVGFYGTL